MFFGYHYSHHPTKIKSKILFSIYSHFKGCVTPRPDEIKEQIFAAAEKIERVDLWGQFYSSLRQGVQLFLKRCHSNWNQLTFDEKIRCCCRQKNPFNLQDNNGVHIRSTSIIYYFTGNFFFFLNSAYKVQITIEF